MRFRSALVGGLVMGAAVIGSVEAAPKPEAAALNLQLSCFKSLIDRYKASDAADYANATLPRADSLGSRISREIAGGLAQSTAHGMAWLRPSITRPLRISPMSLRLTPTSRGFRR